MPLVVGETWRYVCAVCGVGHDCRPGRHPDGWRRLTIRKPAGRALAEPFDLSAERAATFEDHVCSLTCAIAAVARSWDPPGEPVQRAVELGRLALVQA